MLVNSINLSVDLASAFQQNTEKPDALQMKEKIPVSTEKTPRQNEELTNLQNALAQSNISLNFSRDEQSGEIIVKLIDSVTGESIRQLPTEVSLKLSATYTKLQGQFLDKQG